jgi:cell division protease FtsH
MDKQQQYHIWYFVAAFLALLAFQSWLSTASVTERIPYSVFLEHLEADRIASVTVRAEQIEGRYRDPVGGHTHFVTNIVPDDLTARLERSTAEFDGTVQNTLLAMVLSWIVPHRADPLRLALRLPPLSPNGRGWAA